MDDAPLHYPPGADPNPPAPEPAPEPTPEPIPEPEPTPDAPEPKPEDTPQDKKDDEPAPDAPLQKKRSIYDDLKDKKQEVKEFRQVAVAALKAQGIEVTGKETPAQLQELMEKHKTPDAPTPPAPQPEAPSKPTDELEAFATENGLDPKSLARLAEIFAKRVPQADLTKEERQQLADLTTFKARKEAEEQRTTEDNAIRAEAPKIKEQLQVHDDAELSAVMDEIVKLAHSERYHDKEIAYIVWSEREKLSKLVSPKKPSFENGGNPAQATPEAEPDFSSGTGITPVMAERASHSKGGSALEIRRST